MKKLLLFWSMLISIFTIGNAQIIDFPDANFKNALLDHTPEVDTNRDGEISVDEALAVKSITMRDKGITDLTGIDQFTNLETLVAAFNDIDEVDVTHNTKLTVLNLLQNNLVEIDLSNNNDLIYLWLEYNEISDINVSNLTQLEGIGIGGNNITTLDVRNCNLDIITYENSPYLETVLVTGQNASYMFLYNCPNLEFICADEQYIALINSDLEYYYDEVNVEVSSDCNIACEIINFKDAYFKEALIDHLPTVDTDGDGEISTCEAEVVSALSFTRERITNIDEISYFTNLISFSSFANRLGNVNFNNNLGLENLVIVGANSLPSEYFSYRTDSVDLSNNDALENIVLIGNDLENIDVTNKFNLTNLQISHNELTAIDVTDCISLVTLELNDNELTSIDITQCTSLVTLAIHDNDLEAIDPSNNHLLEYLDISENGDIEVLELNNNEALTDLKMAQVYQVEFLDLSNSPNLKSLDASICLNLKELNVSVNSLSSLSISNCRDLEALYMKGNHEFYSSENFENFQLGDNDELRLVCIDPIANFDEFETFLNDAEIWFKISGSLTSNTDCSIMYSSDFSDYFTVYPNPATNYFFVRSTNSESDIIGKQIYDLTISDFSGITIDHITYDTRDDLYGFSDFISIRNYNLIPGIYYLTMNTEIGQFTSSLVVE